VDFRPRDKHTKPQTQAQFLLTASTKLTTARQTPHTVPLLLMWTEINFVVLLLLYLVQYQFGLRVKHSVFGISGFQQSRTVIKAILNKIKTTVKYKRR